MHSPPSQIPNLDRLIITPRSKHQAIRRISQAAYRPGMAAQDQHAEGTSLLCRLGQYLFVRRPRLLVSLLGRSSFLLADLWFLLFPALIDGLEAPLDGALARPDRLVTDQHEHRIGVAR